MANHSLPASGAHLFISHSSRDNATTERLYTALRDAGIDVWLDFRSLTPGDDWRSGIDAALNACQSGLLVLSRHSIDSPECRAEWNRILSLNKTLYVALIDETPLVEIPSRLSILQIVTLTADFEQGVQRLIQSIQGARAASDQPGPTPQEAHGDSIAGLAATAETLPQTPPTLLAGRDALRGEVHRLLDQRTHVLLQGFPGVGKTALALTLAAERLDQGKGPVLWQRAGAQTAAELSRALLRRLDGEAEAGTDDERRILLARLLRERQIRLLVLDDVWDQAALDFVCAALPPDIALLVTSRLHLPLTGLIKELDVLDESAALALLAACAGREALDTPDGRTLCARLGYLPIALEIAGNILKKRSAWTPADLLEHWQGALHELDDTVDFGEASRRTVAALLEISLEALSPDARAVFLAFGDLAAPSATAELLALILHGPEATPRQQRATDDHLLNLHDRGLLQLSRFPRLDGGSLLYYRTHSLAHEYARSQTERRPQPIVAASAAYLARHAQDFDALDVERANLLPALDSAARLHDLALVDMALALTVEGTYFASCGLGPEELRCLEAAATAAEQAGQLEPAHYLWSKIGNLAVTPLHDTTAALRAYEKALALAQRLGNPQREAILHTVMGPLRYPDAEERIAHYQRIAAENQNDVVRALLFNHLGYLECERKNFAQGYAHYTAQVQIARDLLARQGDSDDYVVDLVSSALQNLGTCQLDMGETEAALQTHRSAYDFARQHDLRYRMACALQMMGEDHHALAQKSLNDAARAFRQAEADTDADEVIAFITQHGYSIDPDLEQ